MSLTKNDVDATLKANGFTCTHSSAKVNEYKSQTAEKYIYFRLDTGLPGYARIFLHPEENTENIQCIAGVSVIPGFRHGSGLNKYPKKLNNGEKESHYGRALDISTIGAIEGFSTQFIKIT